MHPTDEAGLNLVEIFNSDQTKLYGTFQTNSTERQQPAGDTVLTLLDLGSGKPNAILKWFYPGSLTGNEFVYPHRQEKELAHDTQRTIPVGAKATNADVQAGD
jgi:hypothetical protein